MKLQKVQSEHSSLKKMVKRDLQRVGLALHSGGKKEAWCRQHSSETCALPRCVGNRDINWKLIHPQISETRVRGFLLSSAHSYQAEGGHGSLQRGCSHQKSFFCPDAFVQLLSITAHAGRFWRLGYHRRKGNQARSLDYHPFSKHWGPGFPMISISMPASHRTCACWVWIGCRASEKSSFGAQQSSKTSTGCRRFMNVSLFQGSVSPLKTPSEAVFVLSCCVSVKGYYFDHHDSQLMKRENKRPGGLSSSWHWEGDTRSCVFWGTAPMGMVLNLLV